MVVFKSKAHRRGEDIEHVSTRTAELCSACSSAPRLPPELERWVCEAEPWPSSLDPAAGELEVERARRKRQQVASTASYALDLVDTCENPVSLVEFGSGSGHLGLLLAHLRPNAEVTLVELKEYSCGVARERVEALGLRNVYVFNGSLDEWAAQPGTRLDVVVGLHLCGLLADAALELALRRRCSACIVPCCFGQIFGSEDHARGSGTAPHSHPRSTAFRDALQAGPSLLDAFRSVAKGADLAVVRKGGAFDADGEPFAAARRCMRIIDSDRLQWAREHASRAELALEASLGELHPASCSPKCSVLIVRAGASGHEPRPA